MPNDTNWTPELKMKALELWNAGGLSLAEVGEQLRPTFSKSAVRSQFERMKKAGYTVREDEKTGRYWSTETIQLVHKLMKQHSPTKVARIIGETDRRATRQAVFNLFIRTRPDGTHLPRFVHKNPARAVHKGGVQVSSLARRPPYEPGHPLTWGCLNSLLPSVGPLEFRP